jgi:hypothetical protein
MSKPTISNSLMLEICCRIGDAEINRRIESGDLGTAYVFDCYNVEHYTEEAQDLFNEIHDETEFILGEFFNIQD